MERRMIECQDIELMLDLRSHLDYEFPHILRINMCRLERVLQREWDLDMSLLLDKFKYVKEICFDRSLEGHYEQLSLFKSNQIVILGSIRQEDCRQIITSNPLIHTISCLSLVIDDG